MSGQEELAAVRSRLISAAVTLQDQQRSGEGLEAARLDGKVDGLELALDIIDATLPAPAVPVEPAWGSVADLRDRLERARRQLDALADDTSDNDEATRLAAKASGVALALSYVNEMPALAAPSPAEPEGPQRERFEPIAVIDPADFVTVRPAPASTGTGGEATGITGDAWFDHLAAEQAEPK